MLKTPLDRHLATMSPDLALGFLAWMAGRPEPVVDLIEQYPPMTRVVKDGIAYRVIGYTETGIPGHPHLLVTDVDPEGGHFDAAIAAARDACPGKCHRIEELN